MQNYMIYYMQALIPTHETVASKRLFTALLLGGFKSCASC